MPGDWPVTQYQDVRPRLSAESGRTSFRTARHQSAVGACACCTLKIPCANCIGGIIVRMARRAGTAVGALLACCNIASALNPSLDINQYAHKAWTIRDGFFKGIINAIAQTPDGYLWLGTEFGLLRFDGVRAVPWQPPDGEQLLSNFISDLLVAHDGTLWIGTLSGLASWRNSTFTR